MACGKYIVTFDRSTNRELACALIRRSWDRPQMLRDGASLENLPNLDTAHLFLGREFGVPVALFIGFDREPGVMDLHACMTPMCRGKHAIAALKEFLEWVPTMGYRCITGLIPAYNKAMLLVALRAGFRIKRKEPKSVMRAGILEDQFAVERILA